jgi:hypothetical protein
MAQETMPILLGELKGADFNITTDQNIPMTALRYIIRRIVVDNASVSLTLAAGGIYTGAGKTGTIIVPAAQLYGALTAAAKFLDLTLTAIIGTDVRTEGTLFFSLTTAQGAAALADIRIFGDILP